MKKKERKDTFALVAALLFMGLFMASASIYQDKGYIGLGTFLAAIISVGVFFYLYVHSFANGKLSRLKIGGVPFPTVALWLYAVNIMTSMLLLSSEAAPWLFVVVSGLEGAAWASVRALAKRSGDR